MACAAPRRRPPAVSAAMVRAAVVEPETIAPTPSAPPSQERLGPSARSAKAPESGAVSRCHWYLVPAPARTPKVALPDGQAEAAAGPPLITGAHVALTSEMNSPMPLLSPKK